MAYLHVEPALRHLLDARRAIAETMSTGHIEILSVDLLDRSERHAKCSSPARR